MIVYLTVPSTLRAKYTHDHDCKRLNVFERTHFKIVHMTHLFGQD